MQSHPRSRVRGRWARRTTPPSSGCSSTRAMSCWCARRPREPHAGMQACMACMATRPPLAGRGLAEAGALRAEALSESTLLLPRSKVPLLALGAVAARARPFVCHALQPVPDRDAGAREGGAPHLGHRSAADPRRPASTDIIIRERAARRTASTTCRPRSTTRATRRARPTCFTAASCCTRAACTRSSCCGRCAARRAPGSGARPGAHARWALLSTCAAHSPYRAAGCARGRAGVLRI